MTLLKKKFTQFAAIQEIFMLVIYFIIYDKLLKYLQETTLKKQITFFYQTLLAFHKV